MIACRGGQLSPAEKAHRQPLGRHRWVAVEVILEERQERELIPASNAPGDGNYYLSAK